MGWQIIRFFNWVHDNGKKIIVIIIFGFSLLFCFWLGRNSTAPDKARFRELENHIKLSRIANQELQDTIDRTRAEIDRIRNIEDDLYITQSELTRTSKKLNDANRQIEEISTGYAKLHREYRELQQQLESGNREALSIIERIEKTLGFK